MPGCERVYRTVLITLYIYLKQYDPAKDGKYDYIIDFRGILTS